jgi:hypothetical protein
METPIAKLEISEKSLRREPSAGCSKGREIGERGMEVAVGKIWVGIDAGKEFHWVHVVDASGRELLSRKLEIGALQTAANGLLLSSYLVC